MPTTVRIGIDWARTIDVTIDGHTCHCGSPLVDAVGPDGRVIRHTTPTGRECPAGRDQLMFAAYRIAVAEGLITAGAGTPREQACALR
jgi:hypothetical protein